MSFKSVRYNRGEEIFKIKIEDPSGAYLENWVFMKCDFPKFVSIISKKYGISLKKNKESDTKVDRDLEWAL